jgi:hypothetical protein
LAVTDANVSPRASDFLEMAKPCVVLDVNLKRPAATPKNKSQKLESTNDSMVLSSSIERAEMDHLIANALRSAGAPSVF